MIEADQYFSIIKVMKKKNQNKEALTNFHYAFEIYKQLDDKFSIETIKKKFRK
jgi:hypothetical protein